MRGQISGFFRVVRSLVIALASKGRKLPLPDAREYIEKFGHREFAVAADVL